MVVRNYGLTWLGRQSSSRLRRTFWNVQHLAEELWTILSRLRDREQSTVEVETDDGSPNQSTDLTPDQIDLLKPDLQDEVIVEQPDPEDPDGPVLSLRSYTFWRRWSLPCTVGAKLQDTGDTNTNASQVYAVQIFPFGDMAPLGAIDAPQETSTGSFAGIDPDFIINTTAVQLQINNVETIPNGTKVMATLIRQYRATDFLRDGVATNSVIRVLQERAYIQVPVWLGFVPS